MFLYHILVKTPWITLTKEFSLEYIFNMMYCIFNKAEKTGTAVVGCTPGRLELD